MSCDLSNALKRMGFDRLTGMRHKRSFVAYRANYSIGPTGGTPMTKRKRIALILALCGSVSLATSGCTHTPDAATSTSVLEPAMTTPTQGPTAVAGDTNGDGHLSEFEKQIIAQNAPRDYIMPNGTIVQIDPKTPLPPQVVNDVKSAVSPAVAASATAGGDQEASDAASKALDQSLQEQSDKLGRGIAVVFNTRGSNGWVWGAKASGVKSLGIMATPTADEMVEKVRSWIGGRNYELLVM